LPAVYYVHGVPVYGRILVDIVIPGGNAMARKQANRTKSMTAVATTPAPEVKPQSVRLELSPDVHRQFRVESAKEGLSMAAVARQLVEEWLSERKAGGK
jgi:hypothetical protein